MDKEDHKAEEKSETDQVEVPDKSEGAPDEESATPSDAPNECSSKQETEPSPDETGTAQAAAQDTDTDPGNECEKEPAKDVGEESIKTDRLSSSPGPEVANDAEADDTSKDGKAGAAAAADDSSKCGKDGTSADDTSKGGKDDTEADDTSKGGKDDTVADDTSKGGKDDTEADDTSKGGKDDTEADDTSKGGKDDTVANDTSKGGKDDTVADDTSKGGKDGTEADDTSKSGIQRPNFTGKYKHIRTENFDNFLRELGVPWLMRKASCKATPSLEAHQQGDDQFDFCLTTLIFTKESKFTIGKLYEETLPFGAKYNVMPSWIEDDGLLLTMVPLDPKHKPQTQLRRIKGNTFTMTMTIGEVVCTRVFQRIE